MGLGTRFGRRSAPLRPASDVYRHPTSWTAESGCLGSEAVSLDALIATPGSIRSVCPAGRRRVHHFGYFRAEREDFFSRWRLDLVESRVGKGSHWAVCTIHCACNSSPKSEKLSHRPETIQKGRRPSAKRQNWAPDHREKIVDIFHAGDRDARSVRRTHVKPLRHTSDIRETPDKHLQVYPPSETGSRRDTVKTRFSRDRSKHGSSPTTSAATLPSGIPRSAILDGKSAILSRFFVPSPPSRFAVRRLFRSGSFTLYRLICVSDDVGDDVA